MLLHIDEDFGWIIWTISLEVERGQTSTELFSQWRLLLGRKCCPLGISRESPVANWIMTTVGIFDEDPMLKKGGKGW